MVRAAQQPESELLQVSNLRDFFRESVHEALDTNAVDADHNTAHYIVNLLTLFARTEAFHDGDDGDARRPLALMLADALDAPTREQQCFVLQRLGDISLFIAGFFADDLEGAVVDLDYYVSMGGGAYSTLSEATRGTVKGRAFGPVFAELGTKFQKFVDVLNDVRYQAGRDNDGELLRQYEVWLRTGSERAARLLRRKGVHPLDAGAIRRPH